MSDRLVRAPRLAASPKEARSAARKPRSVAQVSERSAPIKLGPLANLAGYLIRQAQLWVFQDFNETLAPLDIRPVQYSILTLISENPGLSQMALSRVLGIVRSGLVPLLDNLQNRGLIKRAAVVADRRSYALHLTAEGDALLGRANASVQEHEERLRQKVGPRAHQQLLKLLEVFGGRS